MRIVVVEDGQRTELDLTSPSLRIGRAVDNDLRLAGHLVSRHHCLIEHEQGEWWVTDLGSANGTLLNEVRVSRSRLQPGDRLRVGKAQIEFSDSGVEALLARRGAAELGTATLTDSGARERENLEVFARITRELVRESEPGKLLRLIVDSALALVHGERGFLLLSEDALGEEALESQPGSALELSGYKVRVARNYDREDVPMPSTRLSLGVAKAVLEQKRGLLALDASSDPRFQGMSSVDELRLRSVLCVPLLSSSDAQAQASGVLYVDNRLQVGAFSHEDLASLELLADQAAIALRNVRRTRELRERSEALGQQTRKIEQLSEQLGRKGRESAGAGEAAGDTGRERGRYDYSSIVGQSAAMRRVFAQIDRIVESDLPVVIQGESGTGKELVARAIHFNGPRKAKPFVSENCAALPDTLLESELFGHARGAFTGAHRAKKGLIEQAHGGTLFLDEIGDMSAEMQKKLLRVLQEGELRAVGSEERVKVDVRVIAASHRNLQELVKEGRFREDLYYRLQVLAVNLPPLRARREDIPLLAEVLLARAAREANRPAPVLAREVLAALVDYDWPGNVRELENEMRRIVVLAQEAVRLEHLSGEILGKRSSLAAAQAAAVAEGTTGIRDAVAELERLSVLQAIDAAGGNKTKAAAALGISRFALQRKLDKYGLGSRAAEGDADTDPS
jgi:transcriptional regulator with GAF, ATPase, and Fis domain